MRYLNAICSLAVLAVLSSSGGFLLACVDNYPWTSCGTFAICDTECEDADSTCRKYDEVNPQNGPYCIGGGLWTSCEPSENWTACAEVYSCQLGHLQCQYYNSFYCERKSFSFFSQSHYGVTGGSFCL